MTPAGLEPAASGLGIPRSIHLSYGAGKLDRQRVTVGRGVYCAAGHGVPAIAGCRQGRSQWNRPAAEQPRGLTRSKPARTGYWIVMVIWSVPVPPLVVTAHVMVCVPTVSALVVTDADVLN